MGTPEQYAIRPAEQADLPRLIDIERRADQQCEAIGWAPFPPSPSVGYANGATGVLVAGEPPVGFARVESVDGCQHVHQLAVDPLFQGRGVGSALLRAIEGPISLTTYADVPWNAPFYARRGFVAVTALTPALAAIRRHESDSGLDAFGRRVVMVRRAEPLSPYAAVVLAGGAGRRLGGIAKPLLEVGGRPMLAVVVDAVSDAAARIVVGPEVGSIGPDVTWTREQPAGRGPVAALRAGIQHVPTSADAVVVLAADLPFLDGSTVRGLLHAVDRGADVAMLVDDARRDQYLLAAWRPKVLRTRLSTVDGNRMAGLYDGVHVRRLETVGLIRGAEPWRDVDDDAALSAVRDVSGTPSGRAAR